MSFLDRCYARSPAWAQTWMLNAFALHIEQHRYGRRYQHTVQRLLEQEYWPEGELRRYQDQQLRSIVKIAFTHSRYYRELMTDAGLQVGDIQGTEDLSKFPLLTKEIVRERGDHLLTASAPQPGWLHGHTSGTTGSPLSLWYDRDTCIFTNAVDRRQKAWAGISAKDWIGVFLGRTVVSPATKNPPFWRVNWVQRQVWFSTFHMAAETLDLYVDEVQRRGLRFLEGYPSTLYVLAQHLNKTGRTLPMRAVLTSSETLHRVQQEALHSAFTCEIYDFYGHAERTIFASECEAHDGKHVAEEYGYVEVVDDSGQPVPDGELGYLVGTSLHNVAMPMIRYRTGDFSAITREPCTCGRTLRRIRNIATKAEDIVVTPGGRLISPSVLTHPFKPFPQIVKSQLIQDRIDHIVVKLVPSGEFTADLQNALQERLQERLGPEMTIDIERVSDIPREKSGKYRWVISRVAHDCRLGWDDGD